MFAHMTSTCSCRGRMRWTTGTGSCMSRRTSLLELGMHGKEAPARRLLACKGMPCCRGCGQQASVRTSRWRFAAGYTPSVPRRRSIHLKQLIWNRPAVFQPWWPRRCASVGLCGVTLVQAGICCLGIILCQGVVQLLRGIKFASLVYAGVNRVLGTVRISKWKLQGLTHLREAAASLT